MSAGPDLADAFRQEAAELLETLETALLDLGQRPEDRELIDTAFRALHTIKGSGSMFGFEQVAAFTHEFETAFDLVRKGKAEPSEDLVAVALSAKDYIRTLIEAPETTDPIIGEAILDELKRAVEEAPAGESPAIVAEPVAAAAPTSSGAIGWQLEIGFETDILRNGTNPLALLDELRELGQCEVTPIADALPDFADLDPQQLHIRWRVRLVSDCPVEALDDVFMFVRDEMTLVVTPLTAEEPTPVIVETPVASIPIAVPAMPVAAESKAPPPKVAREAAPAETGKRQEEKTSTTVRVPAERLDELMDRVGELVIAQARLSQIASAASDPAIKNVSEEIARLAAALRDTTMGARMVPIGSLFGRFRRLVHDLSRDLGKPVEFVTSGEETELDKTMTERLADPLVHVIRNAIDHGIEMPERRVAAGKPAEGRIELTAQHVGTQVLVTVKDNGAGLDTARIRAKAEEQGLIPPGVTMSDQEVHQFLFHPGFSTAKTISALSGRGVGMDVVKRTIETMRGSIDLSTTPGQGSQFTLRLPLTLAIIEGLLVRVGEGRYIIPLSAVEECVELPPSLAEAGRERNVLNIRGELVPFLRLQDMFGAVNAHEPHQKVIITQTGDMRVGLVVDQIIGSHQTVIKSLSKLHADVAMFSGATILGDGSAALILDVGQLVSIGQSRADAIWSAEAA